MDEKKFIEDAKVNRRNSRVIAYDPSDVSPVFQMKNPTSLMVYGAAASDRSVINPHFIVAGLKIGTKEYMEILKTSHLPRMDQIFGLDNVALI